MAVRFCPGPQRRFESYPRSHGLPPRNRGGFDLTNNVFRVKREWRLKMDLIQILLYGVIVIAFVVLCFLLLVRIREGRIRKNKNVTGVNGKTGISFWQKNKIRIVICLVAVILWSISCYLVFAVLDYTQGTLLFIATCCIPIDAVFIDS